MSGISLEHQRAFVKALRLVTHGIANKLTLREQGRKLAIKLLIAIRGNYGYLPAWTYLLKIYRKRSQFASKSIICNDAFPLFCEVHLKGQQSTTAPTAAGRFFSPATRAKLAAAARARWARRRGTGAAAPAKDRSAAPGKRKGQLTPAGRRKLSLLMKARWAARRKAGGKQKASSRKKGALTPAGRKRLSELMKARWAARRKSGSK